ncbi:Uncharacterised protein [Bordetella pertussis]|nr:Uncharacterised protein [Bordetella pertussis]CFO07556.1 Uncharacterised protein [Bordetella pertussis]CFP61199.1 Uncharacterised protein [Bordetella pertussis]CFW30486.1 Uncharacterised protein [Bordetella pertussis]CPK68029.1 Uncharacterised protein [Bordetella pertussis]
MVRILSSSSVDQRVSVSRTTKSMMLLTACSSFLMMLFVTSRWVTSITTMPTSSSVDAMSRRNFPRNESGNSSRGVRRMNMKGFRTTCGQRALDCVTCRHGLPHGWVQP